ncbi:MAG: hypothetical protein J0M29_15060 [Chitinophagales bacterium]|nr:hypothetical protein [Chitinophagales bacterium]
MTKIFISFFLGLFFSIPMQGQADTIPPALTCKDKVTRFIWINTLSCSVDVLASECVSSVSDDGGPVRLGIQKPCTGLGFPQDTVVPYDVMEAGSSTAEIWARDTAGNLSMCLITIEIGDMSICDPSSAVRLMDHNWDIIEQGEVKVKGHKCSGDSIDYTIPYTHGPGSSHWSGPDGNWSAWGGFVPGPGYDYEITPFHGHNPLNGVTTYDLALISKHILGLESLDDPLKIIAADVNQDGKVTTFDVVVLRKLILGITSELPNGKSWRFIPANHVFLNPLDPFSSPVPEKIIISHSFPVSCGTYEFKGIKIGDVNFSAIP